MLFPEPKTTKQPFSTRVLPLRPTESSRSRPEPSTRLQITTLLIVLLLSTGSWSVASAASPAEGDEASRPAAETATGEPAPDPVAVGPRFSIASIGETGNPAGLALQPDGSLIAARIVGAGGAIVMRRFSISGTPLGEDLEIIGAEVDNFHLSSGPNGDLVATWDLRNAGNRAWARRFDSMGQAIGDAFEVDESSPPDDHYVSPAAVAADGSFTVSWNRNQGADDHELLGRHFDSTGSAVGSPFVISSGTQSLRGSQIRRLPSSEQVVVWYGPERMRGRNLSAAGLPIGADFGITSQSVSTGVHFEYMDIRAQSNGDFVVAWPTRDYSNYGSYTTGAAFTSVGSPLPALDGLDRTDIDYDDASPESGSNWKRRPYRFEPRCLPPASCLASIRST